MLRKKTDLSAIHQIYPVKNTLSPIFGLAFLASVSFVNLALAVNIDWVQVGNPGNANDSTGYGAVAYGYSIGKYEVTNAQYAEFLNAKGKTNAYGIFNETTDVRYGITQAGVSGSFTYTVDSGFAIKPVNYVSWFDAARFTNWLGNGQGAGDMENGAYTLGGVTSGNAIAKNLGATVYVPSENEWYKAAYYDPNKGGVGVAGYWLYPTKSDTITNTDANYNNSVGHSTNVGTYSSDPSFYGTLDQAGNFWEWNDLDAVSGSSRGLRGGSWDNTVNTLASSGRYNIDPSGENDTVGFRVASFAAVPEPRSLLMGLALLTSGLLARNRGKTSL